MIVLTSIPGNATHFCKDHLLRDWQRCSQVPTSRQIAKFGERLFHFEHIFPHTINDLNTDVPVLVPLRHPMAVAQTWANRGGNRGSGIRIDRTRKPGTNLINLYKLLIEVVDKWKPYYIPVDSDNREDFLSELNTGLGTQFTTDWQIVRNGSCSKFPMDPKDRDAIELLAEHPFFRRFYGD